MNASKLPKPPDTKRKFSNLNSDLTNSSFNNNESKNPKKTIKDSPFKSESRYFVTPTKSSNEAYNDFTMRENIEDSARKKRLVFLPRKRSH